MGVLSAFEMACWDINGKDLNKPAYELLGGQVHEKLRTYSYSGRYSNLGRLSRRDSERADSLGRRLRHTAGQTRPGGRTGRSGAVRRGQRARVYR